MCTVHVDSKTESKLCMPMVECAVNYVVYNFVGISMIAKKKKQQQQQQQRCICVPQVLIGITSSGKPLNGFSSKELLPAECLSSLVGLLNENNAKTSLYVKAMVLLFNLGEFVPPCHGIFWRRETRRQIRLCSQANGYHLPQWGGLIHTVTP